MSLRLSFLEVRTPAPLARWVLDRLTRSIAEAFQVPPPVWPSRDLELRLETFARFTSEQSQLVLSRPDHGEGPVDMAGRLRDAARDLGDSLRRSLGVGDQADAHRALRLLYAQLGISLRVDDDGAVIVDRCRFSDRYTPAVCRLMGAVDEGISTGLTGGRRLSFRERLTEGAPSCRGRLEAPATGVQLGATPSARGAGTARRPHVVVVGSGAGGATVARKLAAGGGLRVTVLEAGADFRPFTADYARLARLRSSELFFDERLITMLFPAMRVSRAADGLVLVRGVATGGTTTMATGNAMRLEGALGDVGLDLSEDYDALERRLGVTPAPRSRWRPSTQALWDACRDVGLEPAPTAKMIDFTRCRRCGRCVLGCRFGARWDARRFLDEAVAQGATLVTGATVERVVPAGDRDGRVGGVIVRHNGRRRRIDADAVILAAGGLGTPAILSRSGLPTRNRLFVDPVLCVAARLPGADQDRELPMPFIAEHDGCLISPYFDHLSFFFDRRWRHEPGDVVSLMIKLADSEVGDVGRTAGRSVRKGLSARDRRRLAAAAAVCRDVLKGVGAPPGDTFLGILNAGHPGGTVPLSPATAESMHPAGLPDCLYVADASLLPASLGAPPSLTVMALARRLARLVAARLVA